jgi:hypothetical protein
VSWMWGGRDPRSQAVVQGLQLRASCLPSPDPLFCLASPAPDSREPLVVAPSNAEFTTWRASDPTMDVAPNTVSPFIPTL